MVKNYNTIFDDLSSDVYVWFEESWSHDLEEHSHDLAQFIYVTKGYQHLHIDDRIYLLPQNYAAWIPPKTLHKTTAQSKSVELKTIFFRIDDTMEGEYNSIRVFTVSNLLKEMILHCNKWNHKTNLNDREVVFLKSILYELPSFWNTQLDFTLPTSNNILIGKVCEYIHQNIHKDLDSLNLAHIFSLSLRTLQRVFKQNTNITVSKYIQYARILKSIELLDSGVYTVSEIAYKVGYGSVQAFSNSFAQTLKIRPIEYINNKLRDSE